MVTESAEQLRDEAVRFFRQSQLPDSLEWVSDLTPLDQRLFAVELSDALKDCLLTEEFEKLRTVIEDWEATAAVAASPEVNAELRRPKAHRPLTDFTT